MPPQRDRPRPSFEQAFGAALQPIRAEKGISQERLGNDSSSGRTYVSQLERGERGPSLKMVFRLARTLGVQPAEIVRRVQEEAAAKEAEF
jgi:transcriptional regulator with XRE-family HTH domain